MNEIIEYLKAGPDPKNTIIRALFALNYSFRYDDESGGVYAIDQGGFILTRKELSELHEAVTIFLDHYGDVEIAEYNAKKSSTATKEDRAEYEEQKQRRVRSGWVYLLEGKDGVYKIGLTTRTPTERLAEISPKMPFDARLIHSFHCKDVVQAESLLHYRYAESRVNGEWFLLEPDDVTYIMNIQDGQL